MLDNPAFQTEFTKGMVHLLRECVDPLRKENAELRKEIAELKAREPKHGRDGKDADPAEVAAIVLKSIQLPKDGKDGRDGKDAEPVDVDDIVSRVVALIPAPKDGAAGKDGIDGKTGEKGESGKDANPLEVAKIVLDSIQIPKDGKDGRDGKDAVIDQAWLQTYLQKAIDEIPKPKDGKDGISPEVTEVAALVLKSIQLPKDGKNGRDGIDGINGKDGVSPDIADVTALLLKSIQLPKDGKDGVGIANIVIDRDGKLIITKTDGSVQSPGIVVGRDGAPGAPGEPGRDGLGFDDMEQIEDGLRFGHRFRRGDQVKEFWYQKATLADFDHEIYRAGTTYPRGAVVTTGGSLFICKHETNERPGTSKHWRLAVKCGRDGKDGEKGPPGPVGPKGENGRMVGFDGRTL